MEIPRLLPARGTRQGGGAGKPRDGGPGGRVEEARAASPARPGPSPLRRGRSRWCGGGGGGGGGGVSAAAAVAAAAAMTSSWCCWTRWWRRRDRGRRPGRRARVERRPGWAHGSRGTKAARTPRAAFLGPSSLSAIPAPVPALAPIPAAPGPRCGLRGHRHYHNQTCYSLATPPPPAWAPGVAPAPQPGGLIVPPAGIPHAAQPGDCPELPPDLLLAERAEPAPAPAPEEEAEGPAAAASPRGPGGPGQGVVLYLCPEAQCGQTFAKKHQLKVHLLTHSSSQGQRPFKCPLGGCGWTFTTSYKLKRHLQSHDKLRPFGCPAEGCGKSFTTVYNLKAHMKGHEQENSFKCEVCEETFPTQAKLSAHQRSHFEPERPYQCAFSGCKKTFITVSALFSHNRAHFREQELFSCSFPGCSKQYDKACRLKIHLRSHTGERPFLCDFEGCGWNFTSMSKLLRHKRKHDDDRRFMCPVEGCGKSFTRAEHLKGHSITHLGTKPFVCPVEGCCARFSARSSLYIHSKKHLQDVDTWKSRCPVSTCNKLFTSKHSMKTHMAKRHNLRQDLLAQLEAANSLTPSSELTSQGQNDLSDAELVSLFSDVPGNSSAAVLDTALVNSGILTIDVASVNSTLAGNLPANNNNSLGQAVDPPALMATSDLPQSLDTSLFFGTTAAGFQQSPLDMDDVSSLSAGSLGSLGSLAMKNSSQEPQALTPSSKLTVDTDALTPSSTLCENSVSELLPPTKTEWSVHPGSDFFGQEEETQFGFSNPAGNHGSQKETDLITVTGSSFLV
nr:zinc finger X-linked protein ZXDB [Camelus dromedarius]